MKKNQPGKRKKWSQKDMEDLRSMYYTGHSLQVMASRLHTNIHNVDYKIFRMKMDKQTMWTQEEDDLLKKYYWCDPDVFSRFPGRSRHAVHHRASKYGLKKMSGNGMVDFDYFDQWSHDVAYIVGFMIADGCVEPRHNRISINLSSKDIDILKSMRQKMKVSNPIFKRKRGDVTLSIRNRKIVLDIMDKGVLPNKTHRTRLPKCDERFLPDIIRGIFDGDGSRLFDNTERIQFLGSYSLLNDISMTLYRQINTSIKKPRKRQVDCYECRYAAKSDVQKINNYLWPADREYMCLVRKSVLAREETPRQTNPAQIRQWQSSGLSEPEGKDNSPKPAETTRGAPSDGMMV